MTTSGDAGGGLAALMARYEPRTAAERADVERIASLAGEADPWSRSSALHVTGSALIVHPPDGRVLLRWHERQRGWLQVGGHGDPGEADPLAVALREGAEETGLDDLVSWPDSGLVHAVIVPVTASEREPTHEHADLRFVLATGKPEAIRPENPRAELRWLSLARARTLVTNGNLLETLDRVADLLAAARHR